METIDESKSSDSAGQPGDRLDSWKEISAYLKKDLRTARRWEKKEGLPVHRHIHDRASTVYAFKSEIEEWRALRKPELHEKDEDGESSGAVPTLAQSQVLEPACPVDSSGSKRRRLSLRVRTLVGAMLGVAILAAVYLISKQHPNRPSRLSYDDNRLVARGDNDRVLWTVSLPNLLREGTDVAPGAIADLDRDGRAEVLACTIESSAPHPIHRSGEVHCFSSDGKSLWHYALGDTLLFGANEFGPPWATSCWIFNGVEARPRIAMAVHHYTWWPSVLVLLDGHGRVVGKYINSGWIQTLRWLERPSGAVFMAGGMSNSRNAAMLAVLDPERISGSSPENSGSEYECKGCPAGKPIRYFVFPRSELNLLMISQYHPVVTLLPSENGFTAHTMEADAQLAGTTDYIDAVYEFALDLELKRASYSDRYWAVHRRLETEGKIKHSREACPDRDGPRLVRSWDPQNGWRDIHPSQP